MYFSFPLAYLYVNVLSGHGAQAFTLAVTTAHQPASDDCVDPHHRTIWNVVQSCLVTIFLCTWVASHPNMLGPQDGKIMAALFRAWLAVDALLTPELVIAWAMQQWFVARKSVRDVNGISSLFPGSACLTDISAHLDSRWTKTHGYFVSMGGFVVNGCPSRSDHPLTPEEFVFLVRKGYIDVPCVTEKEINDKSKG